DNPKIDAALTSNAHTYRLLIVKELYSVTAFALSTKRCVCQLRRRKSMKHFAKSVNSFFFSRLIQHLHASFSEGANYSPAPNSPQALICIWANIAV
ncbi:hypothetical protein SKZ59_25455, partial [Janthinobacterium sp. GMG2]|uniref:hypothetical protein n=1 Tax=Janthinobacterium sp. GMG2 TaxID=3096606 RepID=UPI0029F46072